MTGGNKKDSFCVDKGGRKDCCIFDRGQTNPEL